VDVDVDVVWFGLVWFGLGWRASHDDDDDDDDDDWITHE
jgi:hypothetical protein